MKRRLEYCSKCEEETWHMRGKKQATSKAKAYTRRSTVECTKCGTKEINNSKSGKRIISGKNTPSVQEASK